VTNIIIGTDSEALDGEETSSEQNKQARPLSTKLLHWKEDLGKDTLQEN
jgi:hypothetical protein